MGGQHCDDRSGGRGCYNGGAAGENGGAADKEMAELSVRMKTAELSVRVRVRADEDGGDVGA
jgi:hypothetical protein